MNYLLLCIHVVYIKTEWGTRLVLFAAFLNAFLTKSRPRIANGRKSTKFGLCADTCQREIESHARPLP